MQLLDGPVSVQDPDPAGLSRCNLQVSLPDALEEIERLRLESAFVQPRSTVPVPGPGQGKRGLDVNQEGEVRLPAAVYHVIESCNHREIQSTPVPLVGGAGIRETVAQDPFALRLSRKDPPPEVLVAGRVIEQQLAQGQQSPVAGAEQQRANGLSHRSSAGFPQYGHRDVALGQGVGQQPHLSGLAATVQPLEGNEWRHGETGVQARIPGKIAQLRRLQQGARPVPAHLPDRLEIGRDLR